MAIYRLEVKHVSRHSGLSAHAHARYLTRNGQQPESGRSSEDAAEGHPSAQAHAAYLDRALTTSRSTSRDDLVYSAHGNMPQWAVQTPHMFWREADTYERANGRLYTEILVSLPRELSPEHRLDLVRAFVHQEIGNHHPYSLAVHNSRAMDGGEQPHAHIMVTERTLDGIARSPQQFFARANAHHPEQGGAAKDPTWHARSKVQELRVSWEHVTNRHLEHAGCAMRIDHRSLADQGIDRLPEPKMGKDQTAMLQRGDMTDTTAEVMHLRKDRAHAARLARAIDTTTQQREEVRRERDRRHTRAQELLERPRDPDAARERLRASREARRENARSALERTSGMPHRFAESGEVIGTATGRVDIGRESFVRLEASGSARLVPWHDDFRALMGQMLRVSIAHEHTHRSRVRLVRLLEQEPERQV